MILYHSVYHSLKINQRNDEKDKAMEGYKNKGKEIRILRDLRRSGERLQFSGFVHATLIFYKMNTIMHF